MVKIAPSPGRLRKFPRAGENPGGGPKPSPRSPGEEGGASDHLGQGWQTCLRWCNQMWAKKREDIILPKALGRLGSLRPHLGI